MSEEEARFVEASAAYMGLSVSAVGLYLTLLSGYLIVAYVAGKDLSSTQLWIVNILFLCSSSLIVFAIVGFGYRGISFIQRLRGVDEHIPTGHFIFMGVLVAGICAALYFMHSSRKNGDITHPGATPPD